MTPDILGKFKFWKSLKRLSRLLFGEERRPLATFEEALEDQQAVVRGQFGTALFREITHHAQILRDGEIAIAVNISGRMGAK